MKKRVVCAFLGLVMMVSQSFTVFADTQSNIIEQSLHPGREPVKSDK